MDQFPKATGLGDGVILNGSVAHYVKRLPITVVASTAEQDTGWDLPADAIVTDVKVLVATAEATGATKTMHVGLLSSETGGDADGFAASISVAATGIKIPRATVTAGVLSANTRGALLADYAVGTDAADRGIYVPKSHICNGTAKSITYTLGSNDWVEFVGDIIVEYDVYKNHTQS
jgi:hypothetical protein